MRMFIALILLLAAITTHAQQLQFTVYFDHNKPTPTTKSCNELQQFLKDLHPASVIIKGYTDKTGESQYNLDLSEKRTKEITQLITQYWPDVKIESSFFGNQFPISENDDLNRRVEIIVTLQPPSPKTDPVLLQPLREDVETQSFTINLDDTVIIKGKEGTIIKIPPGAIVRKDSASMHGTVTASLKEYYQPSDILLAGLHTSSTEGMLQTGGMFKLVLIQNGDTALTATRKRVDIRMPMNNPELTNMNVYEQSHTNSDTALWSDTRRQFREALAYWQWPIGERLEGFSFERDVDYNLLRVGGVLPYDQHHPWRIFGHTPLTKRVVATVQKVDSGTLKVHATFRYRRKALSKIGRRMLDTTYYVPYIRAEYEAEIDKMSFINCDRFYNTDVQSELIVQVDGFQGMSVSLYFRKLSTFLAAQPSNGHYLFSRLPEGEEVYIIAMGKKENDIYFAQQKYTIIKKSGIKLTLDKITPEECKKNLKKLGSPQLLGRP